MVKKKKNHKKPKHRKKRKQSKQHPSFLWTGLKWMLVIGLWAFIGLGLLTAWYAADLPEITKNPHFERHAALTIKAADGTTLSRYGDFKGTSVSVENLPPHLIYAVLATEDRRFYQHFGLDPLGLARAVITNLKKGHIAQGGSTITQQLAKNLFLSHERTYKRKIQEALLALWLEKKLSKDDILSAYLNRVYLGSGAYGVDAAARIYFNKTAQTLTLKESALLAGLLKAPSRYSPHSNPDLAEKRAQTVLTAMRDTGYITAGAEKESQASPYPLPRKKPLKGRSGVRYFTDWITSDLNKLIGTPTSDLTVETTLAPHIQKEAEEALGYVLRRHGKTHKITQGALIVMNHDGAILAMVGGRNYKASQFNRATQALRPPGSAFKPFVYLTALTQGHKADDFIEDAPFEKGTYKPKNFNGKYKGQVTLETALSHSLNTATVRLAQETGMKAVIETARKAGIQAKLDRDLSLALGSSGIPLLEMVTAYAVLANGGKTVKPHAITQITDNQDNVVYQHKNNTSSRQAINAQAVKTLNAMLEETINTGTGKRAKLPFTAAGKTGTSQNSRDAWFIGYTDRYVMGVWLGNDDNSPMDNVTGGTLPAAIWRDVMRDIHQKNNHKKREATPPSSLSSTTPNNDFPSLLQRLLGY